MGIPKATYLAIERGIALREVTCEHCGTEFVYALARESAGQGTSVMFLDNSGAEQRAAEAAEQGLAKMLAEDIDPVPCPKCNLYQAPMVQLLRDGSYWWMNVWAVLCLVASIISGAVLLSMVLYNSVANSTKLICGIVLIVTGVMALGFWILKAYWSKGYDPNDDEYRAKRQSCRQPTMLQADVEQLGLDQLLAPVKQAHANSEWSDVRFNCWIRMAIGLFVMGLGIVALVFMSEELIDGTASSNWPTAKATVTSAIANSETENKKGQFITYYFPAITYVYEVQGKEFTGSRFSYEPSKTQDRNSVEAIVQELPPQTEIEIRYKPSNPSVSVMLPGISGARVGLGLFMACLALGGLGFLVFEVRRYLRLRDEAASMS